MIRWLNVKQPKPERYFSVGFSGAFYVFSAAHGLDYLATNCPAYFVWQLLHQRQGFWGFWQFSSGCVGDYLLLRSWHSAVELD